MPGDKLEQHSTLQDTKTYDNLILPNAKTSKIRANSFEYPQTLMVVVARNSQLANLQLPLHCTC